MPLKTEIDSGKNIWSRFREGDMEAFRKIYDTFLPNLYAYGSKLTSNIPLVEDSIQEMFLDLFTHRKNLSGTDNLEYYLIKVLRRTIFHKIKNEARFQSLEDQGAFNIDFEVESHMPDDLQEEKIKRVKDSLASLSPQNKEILYLKFYQGLTYQQIGEMTGTQPDSVKKQVYRIISRLRTDLGSQLLELFILCFKA
ncbi:MAG: RNA polymerase sigma factor [Mangrovibacterium sp.]